MPTVLKGNFPKKKSLSDEEFFSIALKRIKESKSRYTTKRYENDIENFLTLSDLHRHGIQYFCALFGTIFFSLSYTSWEARGGFINGNEFVIMCGSVILLYIAWKISFPMLRYENQIIDYLNSNKDELTNREEEEKFAA